MASSPKAQKPMCVVHIGYSVSLLLPADHGMKLVALLQQSMVVDRDFHSSTLSEVYDVRGEAEVSYKSVKPDQLRFPAAPASPGEPATPVRPQRIARS